MLTIMNVLNGVWLDSYILKIIIHEEVDKLHAVKLDFQDIKIGIKVRDIHKIERKNSIGISVFG